MSLEKTTLYSLFRRNNLLKEYISQEPIFVWPRVAGELKKIARPKKVKGNSLFLEVPSAAAKQELSYLEDKFLERLNERLEHTEIEDLRFELANFSMGVEDEISGPEEDLENISLTAEQRSKLDDSLAQSNLEEPARSSLKRLLITQTKERMKKLKNGWIECPFCGGIYPGDQCSCCGSAHPES